MTPAQSRDARALLRITQEKLAEMACLNVSTIEDFEGERRQLSAGAVASIQVALEAAGVIFVGGSETEMERRHMTRIVEHRSALPNGPVVEVHIRRDATADPAVFAYVNVNVFGQNPDPTAFPERLPPTDAFLQALAYAERAGITVVWVDDPGGHYPPEKRPVRDVSKP
jgi:transcriptional regulator with XRE-family HTH domain